MGCVRHPSAGRREETQPLPPPPPTERPCPVSSFRSRELLHATSPRAAGPKQAPDPAKAALLRRCGVPGSQRDPALGSDPPLSTTELKGIARGPWQAGTGAGVQLTLCISNPVSQAPAQLLTQSQAIPPSGATKSGHQAESHSSHAAASPSCRGTSRGQNDAPKGRGAEPLANDGLRSERERERGRNGVLPKERNALGCRFSPTYNCLFTNCSKLKQR